MDWPIRRRVQHQTSKVAYVTNHLKLVDFGNRRPPLVAKAPSADFGVGCSMTVAGEKAWTFGTVGKYNDNMLVSSVAGGSSSVKDCATFFSARSITHAVLLDES